jgi:hypothetical protein
MKHTVFCNMAPCSLVDIYKHCGWMHCLRFQGGRISQASNASSFLGLLSDSDDGASTFISNVSNFYNARLHDVTSQKTVFIEVWISLSCKPGCDDPSRRIFTNILILVASYSAPWQGGKRILFYMQTDILNSLFQSSLKINTFHFFPLVSFTHPPVEPFPPLALIADLACDDKQALDGIKTTTPNFATSF